MNLMLKNSILYRLFLLIVCAAGITGCNDNEDDGSRAFMSNATVTGDAANGYYCYLDGGGLVVSQDQNLEGIERGYFAFHYMETDWTTAGDTSYIRNAHVLPYSVFEIIHPIRNDEAESDHFSDPNHCQEPPRLLLGQGWGGYFDLNTGVRIFNQANGENVPIPMDIIYDPSEQTPDTLRLELCYRPEIPSQWTNTTVDYGTVSCDISSLADLVQWDDSVTIAVKVAGNKRFMTRISKNNFAKPATNPGSSAKHP